MPIFDDQTLCKKIQETHMMASEILKNTEHLNRLDSISHTLSEIKVGLLAAAVGKEQVPIEVVKSLMKMIGWIIFGLVAILVFVLTGHHLGWISL